MPGGRGRGRGAQAGGGAGRRGVGLRNGMTVLNVAEKNDAAKRLSQLMSRGNSQRREGFSKFNKIYEFDYNLLNYNCKMVMTSVSGHLMTMDFSSVYRNWKNIDPAQLFQAPVSRFVPDNFIDIKRTLEREIRKSQVLVIWTDGDREGENIGFEIIECCQNVKPNITLLRARFSEITPRAIQRACETLAPPDANTSNAVEVRRELDLRIGAAFTRFQTLRFQRRFPNDLQEQLISYGSCQFPTLGFVVERYKQVQDFIPEDFYKIKVSHSKEGCTVDFNWKRGRLYNERVCQMFCRMCQENPTATVTKVSSKPKSKWRPLPLDTVELEKTISRKLRINAKEVMKIAEKLYTNGIISYPRTETNIFPQGMNLTPLVENQVADQQWGEFAQRVLNDGGPRPRQGKKTDNAHPPIHPIRHVDNLQGNEKRVYEFIVRHFLACVSKDAQGKETTVEIDIANEKFSASGLYIIARNYLDVYHYERWNSRMIPDYNEGETFQPDNIEMVQSETRPPPLLTEADLIGLMEKYGIGTDATHAEHIETIKSRQYVGVQNDGTFLPGTLGMGLVEGYDAMGFAMSKPYLRASLEEDLKRICEGQKNKDDVLAEQIRSYREVFIQAKEQVERLDEALSRYFGQPQQVPDEEENEPPMVEIIRKCPKCNSNDMITRKTKENSWMIGCSGYPNCRNSIFLPKFVLNIGKNERRCTKCRPEPVHFVNFEFKRGSVPPTISTRYTGCVGCDEMLKEILNVNTFQRNTTQQANPQRNPATNQRQAGNAPANQRRAPNPPANQRQGNQQNNRNTNNPRGGATNVRNPPSHGANNQQFFGGDGFHGNRPNNQDGSDRNDGGAENEIVCNCDTNALKLTVRKEGPNQGRQFYKCANNPNKCDFFLWADEEAVAPNQGGGRGPGGGGGGANNYHGNNRQQGNQEGQDGGEVMCQCCLLAPIRTVQKEGPNKGKQFYSCSKPRDQGCNFFQWVDEESTNHNQGNHFNQQEDGGQVKCQCNQPAPIRTVQKEGPNKGKQFYSCSKPRDQGCNFFQWVDEESTNQMNFQQRGGGRGGANFRGRGRGGYGGGGGGGGQQKGKKRKCGQCGQEGHNKKSCPFSR